MNGVGQLRLHAAERKSRIAGEERKLAPEIAPIRQGGSGHDAGRHLAITAIGKNARVIGVPMNLLREIATVFGK